MSVKQGKEIPQAVYELTDEGKALIMKHFYVHLKVFLMITKWLCTSRDYQEPEAFITVKLMKLLSSEVWQKAQMINHNSWNGIWICTIIR